MPLFEVAIMEVPSAKEQEEGAKEALVFGPKFVTAKDSQAAALNAVMDNATDVAKINKDRMQVLVRPFV